ncbi:unnamed protein product, partial [Polarella glacialis]
RFRGSCERALSAGVRIGEVPSLSRGATASSSSALPLATEVNGVLRRSSAGSGLARQRSGRRPGSPTPAASPPRGPGDSARPSLQIQVPLSSRGTPGRK